MDKKGSGKNYKFLNLEEDLPISEADRRFWQRLAPPDLSFEEYLEFLEEMGFWEIKKPPPKIFKEEFEL